MYGANQKGPTATRPMSGLDIGVPVNHEHAGEGARVDSGMNWTVASFPLKGSSTYSVTSRSSGPLWIWMRVALSGPPVLRTHRRPA
jgi:hypothetical protein